MDTITHGVSAMNREMDRARAERVKRDSCISEYARDDAMLALDELANRTAAALLEIHAAIDGLASFAGSSPTDRRSCLDAIADHVSGLTYDRREELKELVNDLDDQISRQDAPRMGAVL